VFIWFVRGLQGEANRNICLNSMRTTRVLIHSSGEWRMASDE